MAPLSVILLLMHAVFSAHAYLYHHHHRKSTYAAASSKGALDPSAPSTMPVLGGHPSKGSVGDLRGDMGVKEALRTLRTVGPTASSANLFTNVDIERAKPQVCKYVIANPKAFLDPSNKDVAMSYGIDASTIGDDTPAETLLRMLPVIYIADVHNEYGTLGYILNKRSDKTIDDFYPALKAFRGRPVYSGGPDGKGSSFTMVHRKVGFPENRPLKHLPGNSDFKLFFSPDYAMANELCLTNDARPADFKFFQWSTVWLPGQLDVEYNRKLWLTVAAPSTVLFSDDSSAAGPLYRRVLQSLSEGRL